MKQCFLGLRRNRSTQLIAFLSLLHLIPIWGFKFIPTQDGLTHVYNADILKEWKNPQFTEFHGVYNLNLTLFPNWTNFAFFFIFLHIVPPLIAEKIFVTICVLLFPFSFYYLFGAIDKKLRLFGLLGFLYSYNYLFQMGIYNFSLSVPLCLIAIGYWWKHKADFQIADAAVLNLLLIATYFSHFSSYALLIFALSFLPGVYFLAGWFQWWESLKKLLQFVGYLVPAYFILFNTFLINPETRAPEKWLAKHSHTQFASYRPFEQLWKYFIDVRSLVYFNDSYIYVSWILLAFMGGCIVWTLIQRIREKRIFEVRDGFLFLAIILTVLYFRLPQQYGSPGWINDRVNLYIFPILLGWFAVPKYAWLKRGLIAIMLLMLLWHLGLTIRDYHLLDKDMREFTSGAYLIEPNSVVSVVEADWYVGTHHGPVKYLSPFYQAAVYYCIGNGSHYVGNYEPKYNYFPLHYKNGNWKFRYVNGHIDYLLAWRVDAGHERIKALAEDYELIHETEHLKLLRQRSNDSTAK
jgi:hypothetical protein